MVSLRLRIGNASLQETVALLPESGRQEAENQLTFSCLQSPESCPSIPGQFPVSPTPPRIVQRCLRRLSGDYRPPPTNTRRSDNSGPAARGQQTYDRSPQRGLVAELRLSFHP